MSTKLLSQPKYPNTIDINTRTLGYTYQDLLNKNDVLSQVFTLNIGVTPTSLTTAPPLFEKIYEQLILAVHRTNLLVTVPNPYLVLAIYLVSTIYKDKALTNAL